MNFTKVDEYFSTIYGTPNQIKFALSVLSEYRGALYYALEEGKTPSSNAAYIIDRRDTFHSYLTNLGGDKVTNKVLIKKHDKPN